MPPTAIASAKALTPRFGFPPDSSEGVAVAAGVALVAVTPGLFELLPEIEVALVVIDTVEAVFVAVESSAEISVTPAGVGVGPRLRFR